MTANPIFSMEFPSFRRKPARFLAAFTFAAIVCGPQATVCYSQSDSRALAIRVESREVQIPVMVAHKSYSGHLPVVWDLAAKKLRYGKYRLEVQASDSAGNKTPWRVTVFSVE